MNVVREPDTDCDLSYRQNASGVIALLRFSTVGLLFDNFSRDCSGVTLADVDEFDSDSRSGGKIHVLGCDESNNSTDTSNCVGPLHTRWILDDDLMSLARCEPVASIPKARVDPDPATRAEAVGNAPEDWTDAPPQTEFEASCPECRSVTLHKMPDRSSFPGGFLVPTTHERADELRTKRAR